MEIGRKIFYEKETGNIIVDTGEREGSSVYTTVEQDIASYIELSQRNRDTFDVIELPYGKYRQDFMVSNGRRVNLETMDLEFSYPNPTDPNAPQKFEKALSTQIEELRQEQTSTNLTILELMEALFTI